MKKCLTPDCNKDISHRHHTAKYCYRCARIRQYASNQKAQQKRLGDQYDKKRKQEQALIDSEEQRKYLAKQVEDTQLKLDALLWAIELGWLQFDSYFYNTNDRVNETYRYYEESQQEERE